MQIEADKAIRKLWAHSKKLSFILKKDLLLNWNLIYASCVTYHSFKGEYRVFPFKFEEYIWEAIFENFIHYWSKKYFLIFYFVDMYKSWSQHLSSG